MRLTPMFMVRDVEASSAWLRAVLPLDSAHGGPEFEMLCNRQGQVIAWLHSTESGHEHGVEMPSDATSVAGGVTFYFQVDDESQLQQSFSKAQSAGATILVAPHATPAARFIEFTFMDPNGYRFAVHTPMGSLPSE